MPSSNMFGGDGGGGSVFKLLSDDPDQTFDEDEIIIQFTIYAGAYVDGISFKTNKLAGGFSARGPGGGAHRVDVGNGKLRGFTGKSGYDIDALSVTSN
ncbi:Mannose-binding lectin [Penicillium griseofulvum]|uniref:Mannose-binding lectin n=1 Tax=Penicillium patulum TaxID=5078 RepID=A0A135LM26_PENPA|nr:Mannose-binding lectin [Penicillium griseofulvum]KXG50013.1 Mannose-binding lectin [Penicillium griseofulvum]